MKFFFFIINFLIYPIHIILKLFIKINTNKKNIMILGNHASGGTLIYQLIVSKYETNYVNNISGKFFLSTTFVSIVNYLLKKKISKFTSNFVSKNGNTRGYLEPNEFGWFYRRFFLKGKISKNNKFLKNFFSMNFLSNRPFVFKYSVTKNYKTILSNFENLSKIKSSILIVYIYRNKNKIINSILNRRKFIFKNLYYDYGYFPTKVISKNPRIRISKQVQEIDKELLSFLKKIKKKNKIYINLDKLKKNPRKEFLKLDNFLKKNEIIKKKNNTNNLLKKIKKD